jgi:4-azaleucine resistance transporter AzlC
MNHYFYGVKKGLPIGLGYFAVSFAFGVMCVNGGISPLMATIISFTNLTSAGQFAGVKLIFQVASLVEVFLIVLLINLRYALMSLSLTQKIDSSMTRLQRLICSFGITDEIFAVAITEDKKVNTSYLLGLTTLPLLGWTLGTLLGAVGANFLSDRFLTAMNIALYAMFIAIVVPDAKKSKNVFLVCLMAIALSLFFEYVPYVKEIGLGFKIIISTILSCVIGALIFPRKEIVNE